MRRERRFTAEFKMEVVKLVIEQGYFIPQACRELDVGETALRRWISQVETESKRQDVTLVVDVLNHAMLQVKHMERMLFHSDQGSIYGSVKFTECVVKHQFQQSMSRRGNAGIMLAPSLVKTTYRRLVN